MTKTGKGNILEKAVLEIEKLIFKQIGILDSKDIIIEPKKKFYEEGVCIHEIDLYVKVNQGFDYEHVYIFECKNWDYGPVDKKEISDFNEKIIYTNADIGFLIAKKVTKSANIVAKKHQRIKILKASSVLNKLFNAPIIGKVETIDNIKVEKFTFVSNNPQSIATVSSETFDQNFISSSDIKITVKEFMYNFLTSIARQAKEQNYPKDIDSGIINYNVTSDIDYSSINLQLNNDRILQVKSIFSFDLIISKPIIKSSFDIEKRGRFVSIDIITPNKIYKMEYKSIPHKYSKDEWDTEIKIWK